ncbi:hypothetical protein BSKO_03326 [Bryopsis sp. KO-2023]|nr:hypothetical protein BSKO_03326 [Bryopsis sp. KO-2023]
MSLKLRLAYKLKECFSAVGNRSESPSPPRQVTGQPEDHHRRNILLDQGLRYKSNLRRVDEAQLAELGLAHRGGPRLGFSESTVEQLIETLRSGDEDEKAWAAEGLFNFTADNAETRNSVSMLGAVEPLVQLLLTGNAKGRLYAAYMLSALTSVEESRCEMERCGAVRALVGMLQSVGTPVDGKKGALRAIGRLARSDSAAVELVEAGGLKPIVNLLLSPDQGLLKRCLIALYFLGADKDDLQVEIMNAGALPFLLQLCTSPHQAVQAEAVDVCKVLSRSSQCSESIAEQGGIEVLVRVAADGLTQRSKDNALKALQRMSDCNGVLKDKILKMGSKMRSDELRGDEISQLVGILSSGDNQLREQAAKVVEQVAAADPRASRDLAEPEVVASLIDLLTTGSEDGQAYAAWALARLVEDVGVRHRVYVTGAVPPLLKVLREGGARGQEGASCALEKLASHKEAATESVQGGHLQAFLAALDTGNDRTQHYIIRTLFLLRGVDVVVQDQLLTHGGVPVLVRRCWRGSAEVQALAAAVLHDLCQSPDHRKHLMSTAVVPALLDLANSAITDVAEMSRRSLKLLGSDEYKPEVHAEMLLQDQISEMLHVVEDKFNIRPKKLVEEAVRLVPRGMFVGPNKVDYAYNGDAVIVSDLDLDLPAFNFHLTVLEALQLEPGHSFLEVGCNTGYLVCLAAYIVAPSGRAIGIEGDAVACAFAETQAENLRALGELKPKFLVGEVSHLFENVERFDRIAVSTSFARTLLGELLALLKPFGRMVVPCDGQLLSIREELGLAGAEVLCSFSPGEGCQTDSTEQILSSYEHSSTGTVTRSPSRIPHPSPAASSFARRALGVSRIPQKGRGSDGGSFHGRSASGSAAGGSGRSHLRHDPQDSDRSGRSNRPAAGGEGERNGSVEPTPREVSKSRVSPRVSPRRSPRVPPPEANQELQFEKSERFRKEQQENNNKKAQQDDNTQPNHEDGAPPELKGLILSLEDIKICRNAEGKKCRLGEGGFGMVYKAVMNNVDEVAVKVVKTEKPSPKELDLFLKEVQTLSSLHHRNIVQFYGACLEPGSMFFVTELMRGGDLYSALRNHKETMRWERLGKKVALDVALGVNYLHSQKPPMMHRDLKSPNVLLSEEGVAKIADVGMVRKQVKELVTAQPVMTPLWAAPEVMRKERASIKADIWSYGVLVWELVSGEDITEFQPLAMSRQVPSDKGRIMKIPPEAPEVAKKLFFACTQLKPEDRPPMQNIVEWLRSDGK